MLLRIADELLLWFANRDGIILAFPTLILFPEKRELDRRTVKALLRGKICEPQIQCAVIGCIHAVGARPIIG